MTLEYSKDARSVKRSRAKKGEPEADINDPGNGERLIQVSGIVGSASSSSERP